MGTSVITIRISGNHGCQREKKNGESTEPMCERGADCAQSCVDAVAREMVQRLKATGHVEEALLVHWPYGPSIVVDDLKTGRRTGSF